MVPLSPLELGYRQLPRTPILPQFVQMNILLGLGETILVLSSVQFLQYPLLILSHHHHSGTV